jgi:hypothetical protein
MRLQRLNYNDAEAVDVVFTNVAGATVTLGGAVGVTVTAASLDGNQGVYALVTAPIVGVALTNVPNNAVGMARAYGFVNSVFVFAVGSSVTVNAGDVIGGGAAGSLGFNSTGIRTVLHPVTALEAAGAAICSPGGYIRGFVRAL